MNCPYCAPDERCAIHLDTRPWVVFNGGMETTQTQLETMKQDRSFNIATLQGRKVHLNDGAGKAMCGATSYLHMIPTRREANCAKCEKLA